MKNDADGFGESRILPQLSGSFPPQRKFEFKFDHRWLCAGFVGCMQSVSLSLPMIRANWNDSLNIQSAQYMRMWTDFETNVDETRRLCLEANKFRDFCTFRVWGGTDWVRVSQFLIIRTLIWLSIRCLPTCCRDKAKNRRHDTDKIGSERAHERIHSHTQHSTNICEQKQRWWFLFLHFETLPCWCWDASLTAMNRHECRKKLQVVCKHKN